MLPSSGGFDKLSPNGGLGMRNNLMPSSIEGFDTSARTEVVVNEDIIQPPTAFLICSSTSFALAGIGVPGP